MAAGTRISPRRRENVFAGIVILACGCSIIISLNSSAFKHSSKTSLLRRMKTDSITQFDNFHDDRQDTEEVYQAHEEPAMTLKPLAVADDGTRQWFHRESVNKYVPTTTHPFLRPEVISSNACKGIGVDILIYCTSHWRNAEKREGIRFSWAVNNIVKDVVVKTVFFLGRPDTVLDQGKIGAESRQYQDIVQGDYLDTPGNLTMKGMHALQWINNNCMQAKYIIKADDDMFINTFHLIEYGVSTMFKEKRKVLCSLRRKGTIDINRNQKDKWYVPKNILPGRKTYPIMCYANLVLFTADLVPEFYKASFALPYCAVDDAYIFGILLEIIKNVTFGDISPTISQNEVQGYKDLTERLFPNYIAIHIQSMEYYKICWRAVLRNLSTWGRHHANTTHVTIG